MQSAEWRRWAPLVLAGALLVGTLAVGVIPGLQRQRSLQRRIEEKKRELSDLQRMSRDRESLTREYEVLQARFGPPVGLQPEADLLPRAISELEAVCRAAQVEIVNVQPLQPQLDPEGWARVSLQVTVRGSLDGIARQLLYQLRQASPVMSVDRMDFRRSAESEDRFEGQLLISAYALLTEEAQQTLQSEKARRQQRRPGGTVERRGEGP